MKNLSNKQIKAIGNFLSTYYTDLEYIRNFQRFKSSRTSVIDYLKKNPGTFYQFLIEFRVMRNVHKDKVADLLKEAKTWTDKGNSNNVDKFANHINRKGITHGKIMTSLASKILFLNDPWTIFPFDNLAKKSLNQRTNRYADYLPRIEKYKVETEDFTKATFKNLDIYLRTIEREFKGELRDIAIIRQNRFTDKLLWTGVKIKV